jgi:hypothetical protein
MENMDRIRWLALAILVALVLGGCAKPPESTIEEARTALQAAEDAGAAQYAPEALSRARDSRDQMDTELEAQSGKFVLLRSYRNARSLAEEVIAAANQARSDAEGRKDRLRAEISNSIADLSNRLRSARDQLAALSATAPVNKTALRSRLDTAEQQIAQAQNDIDAERFDGAMATASRARENITGVLRDIERVSVRAPSRKR